VLFKTSFRASLGGHGIVCFSKQVLGLLSLERHLLYFSSTSYFHFSVYSCDKKEFGPTHVVSKQFFLANFFLL
jgi:hypothetical protein